MKKMLCNTYFLVFSIMVFVAALTWFVPAGQYERLEEAGRTYAVPGLTTLSPAIRKVSVGFSPPPCRGLPNVRKLLPSSWW